MFCCHRCRCPYGYLAVWSQIVDNSCPVWGFQLSHWTPLSLDLALASAMVIEVGAKNVS